MAQQPDRRRAGIGFGLAVAIGLIIGFFIKRVHWGLMIGLAIGLLSSTLVRRR